MKALLLSPLLALLVTSLSLFGADSGAKWDDYTAQQIQAEVTTQLASHNNIIAVRVKGLVCESCGLGLRKKISKLKEVDKKRFKKGIKMDVHRMLLYIAYRSEAPTREAVSKAIEEAGYESAAYFILRGKKAVKLTS